MGLFRKKTPEEKKIEELVGKFFFTKNYKSLLEKYNAKDKGLVIKQRLQSEVKENKLNANEIEERLMFLLENHETEIQSPSQQYDTFKKEQEKKKKERREREQIKKQQEQIKREEELETFGKVSDPEIMEKEIINLHKNSSVKNALKSNGYSNSILDYCKKELLIKLQEDKLKNIDDIYTNLNYILNNPILLLDWNNGKLRKGIPCSIKKEVIATNKHSGIAQAAGAYAFGLPGWALLSGTSTSEEEVYIKALLKIVPKGIIITNNIDPPFKIPFENIKSLEKKGRIGTTYILHLKNYIDITFKLSYYIGYISLIENIIDKYASGVEEEGWI